jgi:hypothetical protein
MDAAAVLVPGQRHAAPGGDLDPQRAARDTVHLRGSRDAGEVSAGRAIAVLTTAPD